MNLIKKIILILVLLGLGFYIARLTTPEETSQGIKKESEFSFSAEQVKNLREEIIENYYLEKDPLRKLEKSDEIMEKVVLLFMAGLGMKLSEVEKSLVQNPKSYKDYMKKVLSLCPKVLNDKGPEVFFNDGNDEKHSKLLLDLKKCNETYGGLSARPTLKNDKQKENFLNFEDNIFKKFGRSPNILFAESIFSDLWTQRVYDGKLKGLPKKFVKPYEGDFEGIFRTVSGEQGHIKIFMTQASKSKDNEVFIDLGIESQVGLNLQGHYRARHPSSHSVKGQGPCRGLVLSSGKTRLVHIIRVPGRKGFFGRVYSEGEVVSTFFVMKGQFKKNMNPSRWKGSYDNW